MIAPVAAGPSASVRTRRRSLDASSVAYSSVHGFGHGTAVDISSDVESSDCSLFEERFDSSSSSQSHRAQPDVPYADSLWNSPLSSPRLAGDVSDVEPSILTRSISADIGYIQRCALYASSAVMVGDSLQGCDLCCWHRRMLASDQSVSSAVRFLRRQLSDSALPDHCSEQQPSSSSDDRVPASF
jgi:hypothetical protein